MCRRGFSGEFTMPLIESGSKEALQKNIATEIEHGKDPKQSAAIAYSTQRANDEYKSEVVECVPENVTPATINAENRKYWQHAGGEQN
jgi:hypothetical protein